MKLRWSIYILGLIIPSLCFGTVDEVFNSITSDPNALYAFLKKMPKGGELHYHLAGGAYPEVMLEIAAHGDYCLNEQTLALSSDTKHCHGISSQAIAHSLKLYDQIIRAWSMKNFVPGKESGHDHFFATFYKFMALVPDNMIPLLADSMRRAAIQHELYMEIMIMPDNAESTTIPIPAQFLLTNKASPLNYAPLKDYLLQNKAFLNQIEQTINRVKHLIPKTRQYLGCKQHSEKEVCNLVVRFQYHVLREQPLEKVFAQALHAFVAASRSPEIVGVNLVQAEDGPISLRDYRAQMAIFDFLHRAYPNVSIALHAGEMAKENVPPADLTFHIHDAIFKGHAQRIGHGVDIALEDNSSDIVNFMATHHLAVEINLTSNQKILGISGRRHPLTYYLNKHVPVVLSTDDEGVLRTDLTQQYVEAVRQYHLNYSTIKEINRNALTYSFLPGKSLWASENILVSECQDLMSGACLGFVAKNEKAQLQRQLEINLNYFERM